VTALRTVDSATPGASGRGGIFSRGPKGWVIGPLSGNAVRLFLTSATLLFVELLLIRWIPANVTYIGFFSNFLLMASFLGIGLGILAGRNGRRVPILPFALLLFVVVVVIIKKQLNVQAQSQNELFFGLAESGAAATNFLVLPFVVILVTLLMVTLAMPLGPLLKSMPPLRAYAIDIAGSMTGIALFTLLSATGTDPLVWFSVAVVLVIALELAAGISFATVPAVVALAACLVVVFTQLNSGLGKLDSYSAYYRITKYTDGSGLTRINVNGIPHQALHPVDAANREPFYDQVYNWFPGKTYQNVLIIGAGSGSDVALALARGAGHVDAVEIDPAIQQIGINQHPNHPYQDPRVTRYANDGRAFLRNTTTKYDLVVFALPDSLTLVSNTASLRLESFLFTEQAFADVRDHLAPDGIFVLYNYYRQDWLITKIATMLEDAFGHTPLVRTYIARMATLAAGPAVAALPNGQPPGDSVDPIPDPGAPTPKPATDDWPFLYLRTPFVADYYLTALVILLALAALAVIGVAGRTGTTVRRFSPHFFVLGIAFLLLETRSLVSFSLLFGTTWLVNALAFFAILASVLLAIFINAKFPIRKPHLLYAGLFVSLGIAYLLPPESLLIDPPVLRYALAAILAFAPVFFANLVFSYSFRDTRTADMAFASNLLGAMVGGALEYLALITGYQALLLLVALLYGLAYLFATRFRRLADKELAIDEDREPAVLDLGPEPAAAS
jgi:SAM-dependent methyltransferase